MTVARACLAEMETGGWATFTWWDKHGEPVRARTRFQYEGNRFVIAELAITADRITADTVRVVKPGQAIGWAATVAPDLWEAIHAGDPHPPRRPRWAERE
jgi:hypothetical protein